MTIYKTKKTTCFLATVTLVALISPALLQAAPGTLAKAPLFLSSSAKPNILFIIDDSGSMDWGITSPESDGLISIGGTPYHYTFPNDQTGSWITIPIENNLTDEWRARFSGYNSLYYDPAVTYIPWPGDDPGGNTFGDSTPGAAMNNPAKASEGTIDLTAGITTTTTTGGGGGGGGGMMGGMGGGGGGTTTTTTAFYTRYYTWTDSNSDGVVNLSDTHTLVEIKPAVTSYTGSSERSDCASAPSCDYAEEIQNFANWYSYYRKREYVAKSAYGQVIAATNGARMGLLAMNNSITNVNTRIQDMNTDIASGYKGALLDSVYNIDSSGGTPLRTTLNQGGKYLSCQSNNLSSTCPAASTADGGECQQNFSVLMTDGYYNGSFDLSSSSTANSDNEDGDDQGLWDSGTTGPFGDTYNSTLADIAMHYYETDLRSATANKVPTIEGVDENPAQHMVTYTIAFGVDGTLTDATMPTDTTSAFAWPNPATGDAQKIDDMRHAAWNGRGKFLSAKRADTLITGLRSALASIAGRTGSSSSVAFNSGSLSTTSEVYLALFDSQNWNGDLLAYPLDPATGSIGSDKSWSAAENLDSRNLSSSSRTILTNGASDGIALQWTTLTTAQKNDFRTSTGGTLDNEASGMARLGHFRGDRFCEASSSGTCSYSDGTNTFDTKSLRERVSRLGDILDSGPVFSGKPESNWPDISPFPSTTGTRYSTFRSSNDSRTGIIYVGANDGMLHAFSQQNGEEIMAYVPSELFSTSTGTGLHYLSESGYTHNYYVDLTPTLSDVYIKTSTAGTAAWKTVLVGGLRGGGRGIYALDITDPSAFSETATAAANTVLWEFNNSDDNDLGYTFSKPSIVPLQGPGNTIRWAAIFGNGYNDTGSGEAKLFILFLEGGLDGVWTTTAPDDIDYIEISTGVGDTTTRNGLATPAVIDSDGDGYADRVYAGDLRGNMWAFDLSGSDTSTWDVAYSPAKPLFTAAANQPITATPTIVRNSETVGGGAPNTLVIFGTGQYLTTADISTTSSQTMYGVWDSGTAELSRSNLVSQTITAGTTSGSVAGRTLSDNTVDYATKFGWYIDLPDSGERTITNAVIRGESVFFNTSTPDTQACSYGGTSWLMVAKWANGGNPDSIVFSLNGDTELDGLDEINSKPPAGQEINGLGTTPVNLGNKRYVATTETTSGESIETTVLKALTNPNTGRLSWEEIEL